MTKLFKRITAFAMATVMASSAAVVASAEGGTPVQTRYTYRNAADFDNGGFVVWANGKDIKAKKSLSGEDAYFKTDVENVTGEYSGGKWTVMVTPFYSDKEGQTEYTVEAFLKLFTTSTEGEGEEGVTVYTSKLTNDGKTVQKAGKALASAKIKEGKVTVTAGKTAGKFKVWIYEVKAKKVVNAGNIKPVAYGGETKYAPTSIILTTKNPVTETKVAKTAKGKLEEIEAGKSQTYYIADSKADTTTETVYKVTVDGKEVAVTNNAFDVTPSSAGKVKIVVTCEESGKKASFTVKVKAATATSGSTAESN